MDDNRTYSGYIARLIGLVIAMLLFGLAIWFVVQLFQRDSTTGVVDTDEPTNSQGIVDTIVGKDAEIKVDTSDNETLLAATDAELADTTTNTTTETTPVTGGTTVATADADLPNTGPEETLFLAIALVALTTGIKRYAVSRSNLYNPAKA